MFGLLKKSDFDAENIFIKSQISSSANDIQDKLSFLTNELFKTQEQLRQNQNIILDLKNIIEKLNNFQNQQSNNSIVKKQYFNNLPNVNSGINFADLTCFLTNLYANKTCLVNDENRILEKELEKEIINYLENVQNINVSSKKNYPNFPSNYSREADILTINKFKEIQSIIELKRWDIAYGSVNEDGFINEEFGCTIHSDRALHYIALNKLALSKSFNPEIKHYYICIYENHEGDFKKGYIAAKKKSRSAGYGPLPIKQDTARNFINFEMIKREYSINLEITDNQKNTLEDAFQKIYTATDRFDFDYIDNLKLNINKNIFSKKQCQVIQDKQINNTILNQQQINNYPERQLAKLPVNWRIRIIEVL